MLFNNALKYRVFQLKKTTLYSSQLPKDFRCNFLHGKKFFRKTDTYRIYQRKKKGHYLIFLKLRKNVKLLKKKKYLNPINNLIPIWFSIKKHYTVYTKMTILLLFQKNSLEKTDTTKRLKYVNKLTILKTNKIRFSDKNILTSILK